MTQSKLQLPPAKRYLVTYKTLKGETVKREVSAPIEANDEKINVYAFADPANKGGVRSFLTENILDIRPIGRSLLHTSL